jgi:hypothetical protein
MEANSIFYRSQGNASTLGMMSSMFVRRVERSESLAPLLREDLRGSGTSFDTEVVLNTKAEKRDLPFRGIYGSQSLSIVV